MSYTTTTPPPFDCQHLRFHTHAEMNIGNGPFAGQWFCTLVITCTDCGVAFGIIDPNGKVIPNPQFPIRPVT
jgi:hypothetical protein